MLLTWGCSNSSNSLSSLEGTRWVGQSDIDGHPDEIYVLFFVSDTDGQALVGALNNEYKFGSWFTYSLEKPILRISSQSSYFKGDWIIDKISSKELIINQRFPSYKKTIRLERDEPLKD